MVDTSLQRALEMGITLRRATEAKRRANVVAAAFTQLALLAWDAYFEGDAVADGKGRGKGAADAGYDAAGFVAEG